MKSAIGFATALMLVLCPALAADRKIRPMPPDQCRAMVNAVSKAVDIPLSIRTGPPPDWMRGLSGDACLASGKATGLSIDFSTALRRLQGATAGWTYVLGYDLLGDSGMAMGVAKGPATFVYYVRTDPPAGTCEHTPVGDCKLPRRQWHWTLDVTAFVE